MSMATITTTIMITPTGIITATIIITATTTIITMTTVTGIITNMTDIGFARRLFVVGHAARAADSAGSLPRLQPNSGLPEFGHVIGWPKSETSDFGWRGGEGVTRHIVSVCPLPVPPPQAGEGTLWRLPSGANGSRSASSSKARVADPGASR